MMYSTVCPSVAYILLRVRVGCHLFTIYQDIGPIARMMSFNTLHE